MTRAHTLADLAGRVGARVIGDAGRVVRGVAALDAAGPEDLSFFTNPRYRAQAEATRAGAIVTGTGVDLAGHDRLETDEPHLAWARLVAVFHPPRSAMAGISPDARVAADAVLGDGVHVGPFAVVDRGARVGDRCRIGSGAVVGEGCELGPDTILEPRVVLYAGTRVGARCHIHAGTVLGADGFGFATSRGGEHVKIPQIGRVVVEDDVEIGALAAVDRAALGETVIGRGTKIDDLVMVAHGVHLGPHCLLAAQSGIAGSTRVGGHAAFGGQSGASGHLEIGDHVSVGAKSAVLADVAPRSYVVGIPAEDHREWKRTVVGVRKLGQMRAAMRAMAERLAAAENALARLEEDDWTPERS